MTFRTCVAAASAALLLAACSSDSEPRSLPPVPTTTATATPVVLPLPSEAAAATPQGAAAFARYYMGVLSEALSSGDARQLRALSDAGCGGCTNFIGAAEGGEPGGRIEDGRIVVEFAEAPPLQDEETIVLFRYKREAGVLYRADGTVAASIAPEPAIDAEMRLMRRGASWIVLGLRGRPA